MFKCGFCQKVYSTIEERMSCEIDCAKEKKNKDKLEKISIIEKELEALKAEAERLDCRLAKVWDDIYEKETELESLTDCGYDKCTKSNDDEGFFINNKPVSDKEFFQHLADLTGTIFNLK